MMVHSEAGYISPDGFLAVRQLDSRRRTIHLRSTAAYGLPRQFPTLPASVFDQIEQWLELASPGQLRQVGRLRQRPPRRGIEGQN